MVSTRRGHSVHASAVARHISSEGCQFVVGHGDLAEGQRFSFALDGHAPIRGTVRWVVNDRAGFAFDRPLTPDAQQAIQQRAQVVQGLDLYLS